VGALVTPESSAQISPLTYEVRRVGAVGFRRGRWWRGRRKLAGRRGRRRTRQPIDRSPGLRAHETIGKQSTTFLKLFDPCDRAVAVCPIDLQRWQNVGHQGIELALEFDDLGAVREVLELGLHSSLLGISQERPAVLYSQTWWLSRTGTMLRTMSSERDLIASIV